jgi:WD40 repeat protein
LPPAQQARLRQLLLRLVNATDDNDAIRARVPRTELAADPDRQRLLDVLTAARLITTDRDSVEVAHECLARAWPRLRGWLDDDVEGRRILRHLAGAAQTWQQMGRPDSELYRGVRLTQTLAWAEHTDADLTGTERDFLTAAEHARTAEIRAADQAARARARGRRRSRLVLGATIGLVVVALVAAVVAVRQQQARDAADRAALAAEAGRVDDAARSADELDRALLYAVQAIRIHDAPDTRAALLDLLSQHPALVRSVHTGPVLALDSSPDGTTVVVGTDHSTDVYNAASYRPDPQLHLPDGSSAAEFSPDGRQIALIASSSTGFAESNVALSAQVIDVGTGARRPLTLDGIAGNWVYGADVSYSADDHRLAAYAVGAGNGIGVDTSVQDTALGVWDVNDPGTPLNVIHRACWAMALGRDGTRLYVGTVEEHPTLSVLDVATGRTLHSVPVPRASILASADHPDSEWTFIVNGIQVSPDGTIVAVAEGNVIGLYDAATLTPIRDLRRHTGPVRSLRFSSDGRLLASGGDDGLAVVWDVASQAPIAVEAGGTKVVRAVTFAAPDGRTLYTGGDDQQLLAWDLRGDRRFIRVLTAPDPIRRSGAAIPAPDGATVVNVGIGIDQDPGVRFHDVATGELGPAHRDPGGSTLAQWLPPDNARVATAADSQVRIWDRATGQQTLARAVTGSTLTAFAAPTATALIAADTNGTVLRLDPSTLNPTGPAAIVNHRVTAVAARPDGHTAIALLDNQQADDINLDTGRVLTSRNLGFVATAAAVSPDGQRLAVGGTTGQVGLFNLDRGTWISPPNQAHQLYVTAVQFAADGATLVTSTVDSHVTLWDGRTGQPIGGITAGTAGSPARAVILPDGTDVLIATRDHGIYRWSAHPEDWITYACDITGRNLTATEWAVLDPRPYTSTCTEH